VGEEKRGLEQAPSVGAEILDAHRDLERRAGVVGREQLVDERTRSNKEAVRVLHHAPDQLTAMALHSATKRLVRLSPNSKN
jgi:vacuolar-type H+-ATPase subunit H